MNIGIFVRTAVIYIQFMTHILNHIDKYFLFERLKIKYTRNIIIFAGCSKGEIASS